MDPNFLWHLNGEPGMIPQFTDTQRRSGPHPEGFQAPGREPFAACWGANPPANMYIGWGPLAPQLQSIRREYGSPLGTHPPTAAFPQISSSPPLAYPNHLAQTNVPGSVDPSFVRYPAKGPTTTKVQGDTIQTSSYPAVRFVEGNKFPCPHDWCSASFTRSNDLVRHLNTASVHKTPSRDGNSLVCKRCGEGFSRPDALKRHATRNACSQQTLLRVGSSQNRT